MWWISVTQNTMHCIVKKNMFGEFNEATQLKNLTRQKFDKIQRFSGTNASASNSVFEAVRQTLHITACEKVCRQTNFSQEGCSKELFFVVFYLMVNHI